MPPATGGRGRGPRTHGVEVARDGDADARADLVHGVRNRCGGVLRPVGGQDRRAVRGRGRLARHGAPNPRGREAPPHLEAVAPVAAIHGIPHVAVEGREESGGHGAQPNQIEPTVARHQRIEGPPHLVDALVQARRALGELEREPDAPGLMAGQDPQDVGVQVQTVVQADEPQDEADRLRPSPRQEGHVAREPEGPQERGVEQVLAPDLGHHRGRGPGILHPLHRRQLHAGRRGRISGEVPCRPGFHVAGVYARAVGPSAGAHRGAVPADAQGAGSHRDPAPCSSLDSSRGRFVRSKTSVARSTSPGPTDSVNWCGFCRRLARCAPPATAGAASNRPTERGGQPRPAEGRLSSQSPRGSHAVCASWTTSFLPCGHGATATVLWQPSWWTGRPRGRG